MKFLLALLAFAALGGALLLAAESSSASVDSPRVFLGKWGSPCNLVDEESVPVGAGTCLDPDGASGPMESGDGQFSGPLGIAVDPVGAVYVADTFNHRIQAFSSDGSFLGKWGKAGGAPGSGDGEFNRPRDLATDAAGNVYVADTDNHRIQKFSASGTFIGWAGKCTSGPDCDASLPNERSNGFSCTAATCSGLGPGNGDGQFSSPHGLDVDAAGKVFVADSANNRMQLLDSNGVFLGKVGSAAQFSSLHDVVADSGGMIYVADSGNHRIQVFDSTLNLVDVWGMPGSTKGQFALPGPIWGVATDTDGNVFVTDGAGLSPPARVLAFSSSGEFLFQWGTACVLTFPDEGDGCVDPDGGGPLELGDGQFWNPHGIAIGPLGNIFVADSGNDRIQVFGPGAVGGVAELPDVAGEALDGPERSAYSRGRLAGIAAVGVAVVAASGGAAWCARRRWPVCDRGLRPPP